MPSDKRREDEKPWTESQIASSEFDAIDLYAK
jgi:hypothetical protein